MNEELMKDFWKQINDIEQLICKLNNCQSIIAICAERTLGDESGALWAASDILNETEAQMDEKIYELMKVYRQLKEPTKKEKKK